MRRRNHRSKIGETLGKTDPSNSRPDSKLRKRANFVGVDDRNPSSSDSPEARAGRCDFTAVDAKTSEYAFFKKLKSDANRQIGSKLPNTVGQSSKMFESNVKSRGINDRVKDGHGRFSFSTPVETARHEKDSKQSSTEFRDTCGGDKDVMPWVNNVRSGGITDHTEDVFYLKRKRLRQWVKNIWFPDIAELSSSRCDLVPVLLARLFPEAEDKQISKLLKEERIDIVKMPKFLDSPGSKLSNKFHESHVEVGHKSYIENGRSIFWLGWPEESIAPTQQFPTALGHSSVILRDPEEISFAVSYSKGGDSFHRPPFLKKSSALCSDEGNLSCYPVPSPWFRNLKPLSPIYLKEKDDYRPESFSHELDEPTLLLEWNTVSRRNTDDLPLNYHKKLITYPNVLALYGDDHPWNLGDASHNLGTKELWSLPLISHDSPDSFFFPITNSTSYFEEEPRRHITGDRNAVSRWNLHAFHHMNSSDDLARITGYYHQLPYSPLEHHPYAHQMIEGPGYETPRLPFSSSSDAYLLEAPRRTDCFKSHDSSQAWIDSLEKYGRHGCELQTLVKSSST